MKILITGGLGFIASHITDLYIANGHSVFIVDDVSTGNLANLNPSATLIQGDITNSQFISDTLLKIQPEVVNHHAAQVSVVNSVDHPLNDATRNILGTINLLEAIRQLGGVKKIIYATSGGAMYGQATSPINEETTANPMSPYGLSKHTAERYVWLYTSLYNWKATVLRYANVYGPRQDPRGEAGVCAIFSQRMLDGQPVSIFGDGTQTRDYVFVEDIAKANLAALERGDNQAFNISTGVGTSTQAVYQTIKEATGYSLEPIMAAARPGEVQEVILSPKKAAVELGWRAEHSFKEGINKLLNG